jgi:NAD-dependent SIR2 family protein deacetylase
MWITKDTELPEDLLEAQDSRKLVIFAGAGVSIDQPAGMPSFPALIRQLAEEHGEDLPEWAQSQPDLYMGELVEAGFPVHERVADILSLAEGATFNDYHSGLTRLFRDPADVRVVTTNHDPFFTLAAETLFPNRVESFYAPALPPGDEVAGIAYLHGGIARPPDRLVLTARCSRGSGVSARTLG